MPATQKKLKTKAAPSTAPSAVAKKPAVPMPNAAQLALLKALARRQVESFETESGIRRSRVVTPKGTPVPGTMVRRVVVNACVNRGWLTETARTETIVRYAVSLAGKTAAKAKPSA